jgi:hypothetical protein
LNILYIVLYTRMAKTCLHCKKALPITALYSGGHKSDIRVIGDPEKLPLIEWVSHDKLWGWSGRYIHSENWDIQKLLEFARGYRQSIVYKNGYSADFNQKITTYDRRRAADALHLVINYVQTRNPFWKKMFYGIMKYLSKQHYPNTKTLMRRVEECFVLLEE